MDRKWTMLKSSWTVCDLKTRLWTDETEHQEPTPEAKVLTMERTPPNSGAWRWQHHALGTDVSAGTGKLVKGWTEKNRDIF